MAEGAILLPDRDLGAYANLPDAPNAAPPMDRPSDVPDLGDYADLPDTSPTPATDRETGSPDLGAYAGLPDKSQLGDYADLPDAPKPIGAATATALAESPTEPPPPREEISPTPYNEGMLNWMRRQTEEFLAPGQDSGANILAPESADFIAERMGLPARVVAKGLEKLTGLPYAKAEKGVEQATSEAIHGFTSLEGIASLANPFLLEAFAVNTITNLPNQYGRIKEAVRKHGFISKETGKAMAEAGIADVFGFLAGHGAKLTKLNRPAAPGSAKDLMQKRVAGEESPIAGPALVGEKGNIVASGPVGATHADLMRAAIGTPHEEAVMEAFGKDEGHKFLDEAGNVWDREPAASIAVRAGQVPETVTKLQSEDLIKGGEPSATEEGKVAEDIRQEPEDRVEGGQAEEAGSGDRIQPAAEVRPEEVGKREKEATLLTKDTTESDIMRGVSEGKPISAEHFTTEEFESFDPTKTQSIGTHFGTSEQIAYLSEGLKGRTIKANVRLENPLILKSDLIFNDANSVVKGLRREGHFNAEDAVRMRPLLDAVDKAELTARFGDEPRVKSAQKAALNEIQSILEAKGYDGIIYPNAFERRMGQKPSYSVGVFDVSKIEPISEPTSAELGKETPSEPSIAAPAVEPIRAAVERMDTETEHSGARDLADDLEAIDNLPQSLKDALLEYRKAVKEDREQFGERSGLPEEAGAALEAEARRSAGVTEEKAAPSEAAPPTRVDIELIKNAKTLAEAQKIGGQMLSRAETAADMQAVQQALKDYVPPAVPKPPQFAPKSKEPTILNVQGKSYKGDTEAKAWEKARADLAPYMPPNEFEAAILKEPDFSILEAPKLETAAEQKARQAAESAQMAEYLRGERRAGDELFKAISMRGGLPSKTSPHWEAELESLWENPKARRLFRKTAKPLDRLREGLQEAGFEFDVPADMLTAIDERSRSGKMMFATKSNVPGEDMFGFGPGAAAAPEIGLGREPIQMTNAAVDARREAEGREQIFSRAKLADPVLWDRAMNRIDRNPNAPAILVDAINAGEIKSASNIEQMMLLHEELRLQNEKTMESVRARDDSLGEDLQADHRANYAAAERRLDLTQQANRKYGSIAGAALRARRIAAFDDFTLAAMETRARNAKGGPLTEAESMKIEQQAAEIEKLKGELAARPDVDALAVMKNLLDEQMKETKAAAKAGKGFVETLHSARDAAMKRSAERRRQGRLYSGVDPEALLDAVIIGASHIADGLRDLGSWSSAMIRDLGEGVREHLDDLFKRAKQYHQASEKAGKPKEKPPAIDKVSKASEAGKPLSQKMIYDLMREHINDGLVEGMEPNVALDTLVQAVKDDVQELFPDVTPREIRDAFTEYGKQQIPSKEKDLAQLRELRRLGQLRSAIEDVISKERPRKTGLVRDKPTQAIREKMKELNDAMREAGFESTGPEQLASRNVARETALKNQIADIEKELATGERRKPAAEVPDSEAVRVLRARRDALRKQLEEVRRADPGFEAAQQKARLARYKTYLDRRMAEVKERISKSDYAKREKKQTVLDKEAKLKQFQLVQLKKEFNQGVIDLKLANRTRIEKFFGGGRQVLNTSRALITSADLSAVLRQGGFIVLGHPVRAATSFGPMLRAFRSERARFEINQEIRDRPNAPLYEQSKLYLHDERDLTLDKMEEVYMSRWAGKIPIVAGSERAYTTFLNKLRADSFDAMIQTLGRGGHEITLKESKAIANFINVATGRGNLDGVAKAAANLNTIFFAPRYVASRFQLMLGEPLYGGTAATRRMIALEYGRTLAGLAVIYALGKLAGGTMETDRRSSDFGKIKFGNTRLDPMFGVSQTAVFVSRLQTRETKQVGGKVVPLTGKVPFGAQTIDDVIWRFIRSKLSPSFGAAINITAGKDVVGNPVTPMSELFRNITPLAFSDVTKAMQDQGVPKGAALGLMALFGMGLQTYTPRKPTGAPVKSKSQPYVPVP